MRMRVLHIITGPLAFGGAEIMLYRLIAASRSHEMSHEVMSLTELGVVADQIRELGVPTHALGMPRNRFRIPDPVKLMRLVTFIRAARPDVVQTWLYHADLLGGLAAKLAGGPRIFWGLHNSTVDTVHTRRTTRWTVAVCAKASRWIPDGIVTVSQTARYLHVAAGYDPGKFVFIPNGFDVTTFRPDPEVRRAARAELGLPEGAIAIGMVARFDPQKDHPNFIQAAALLAPRLANVRFVLCGLGAAPDNADLLRLLAEHGARDRFRLLGRRSDIPRVMNALDVCTMSSSFGEAFPLAIGEAMSCGIPCVVTDVGDGAYLVGDTGRVVPPRDSAALAGAWEALARLEPDARRRLGLAARERIARNFALARVVEQYADLYRRALGGAVPTPSLNAGR
jgi:glycosyltransferase involved in cell wall biosynthesis